MKKILDEITRKRNGFNEKLKNRLERMTPDARMRTILILLTAYALATVFFLVQGFSGGSRSRFEVKHIEPAELEKKTGGKPAPNDSAYRY